MLGSDVNSQHTIWFHFKCWGSCHWWNPKLRCFCALSNIKILQLLEFFSKLFSEEGRNFSKPLNIRLAAGSICKVYATYTVKQSLVFFQKLWRVFCQTFHHAFSRKICLLWFYSGCRQTILLVNGRHPALSIREVTNATSIEIGLRMASVLFTFSHSRPRRFTVMTFSR